ncbi:MAG TPA: alpha/beta fold hydrolase [Caulobacteraceae bacterium]|nr:alpha/beta fold hydrolase [Caulobacteraceae bacterium]
MQAIGGRRLHVVRAGEARGGRPLVTLEAGAFGFSADWAMVQEGLADRGFASLAYDRAGLGLSDPGPEPRDGRAIVADFEAILTREAPAGPLILAGHSMAGLHVHHFAVRHPGRVAGIVLVDATTPASMDSKMVSAAVGQFAGAARLAAWGAGTGLLKALSGTGLADRIGLDGEIGGAKRWAFADADHNRWAAEEVASWADAARQARESGELDPAWPVAVVLAGPPDPRSGLKALQAAPALASRQGRVEHVAGANHASILAGPHATAIVRGVEYIWEASRGSV